jgi:hypothetical protein
MGAPSARYDAVAVADHECYMQCKEARYMDMFSGLGLSGLALLSSTETRSISAENPTGARWRGACPARSPESIRSAWAWLEGAALHSA